MNPWALWCQFVGNLGCNVLLLLVCRDCHSCSVNCSLTSNSPQRITPMLIISLSMVFSMFASSQLNGLISSKTTGTCMWSCSRIACWLTNCCLLSSELSSHNCVFGFCSKRRNHSTAHISNNLYVGSVVSQGTMYFLRKLPPKPSFVIYRKT